MTGLHPPRRAGDHLARNTNDVLRRPVVLDEIDRLGLVVLPEAADELDARLPELIHVLVVITDRHQM